MARKRKVGQEYEIDPVELEAPIEEVIYVVQCGDTLNKIAEAHNVDKQEIIDKNGLNSQWAIYPGMVLKL